MKKKNIETVLKKKLIIKNILSAIEAKNNYLILGHKNPDDDCISSMVAFAILLIKFNKSVKLYLSNNIHEHYQYLLNICKYNSIEICFSDDFEKDIIDTIVICDTPKPSMIDAPASITSMFLRNDIVLIEIDHHIGGDSEYIGDEKYCLVTEASSACELIGMIGLELCKRKKILKAYNIMDPLSRNFVLSVLSGIIGDTKMGKYIKSKRENRFYQQFSARYNSILQKETMNESNFSDQNQVFRELRRLSQKEEFCFNFILSRKKFSQSIGYVVLDLTHIDKLISESGSDIITDVTRAIADVLAEESGRLSLIAYYDDPLKSDLIQFRVRRSKNFKSFDVRQILKIFSIENGGGHEGAIGFRVKKSSIENLDSFVQDMILRIEQEISGISKTVKTIW